MPCCVTPCGNICARSLFQRRNRPHIERHVRTPEAVMKIPGPDHPISISPNPKRVRVSAGDVLIADTSRALSLEEASYPPVQYIPREDVRMALLSRSERTTHCPYKGDASYF